MVQISSLTPPHWLQHPAVQNVIQAFSVEKQPLRFIGGCVRDTLMQRLPEDPMQLPDIDACTPAAPEQIITILEKHNIKAVPTGIEHGTITAVCQGVPIEITTLRKDIDCDGRHASVQFTTDWEEDAARRDFTINAIALDANGTLYDYHNGQVDIAANRIRFIGDPKARIAEDYLRILRYFRFLATHSNSPAEPNIIEICREAALHVEGLSGERIAREMEKMLNASNPYTSLIAMQEAGLSRYVFATSTHLSPKTTEPCVWLRLALILRTNQGAAEAISQRWKLSKTNNMVLGLLTSTEIPTNIASNEHNAKRFIRQHGNAIARLLVLRAISENPLQDYHALLELCQTWQPPNFPVMGRDLMEMGQASGKELGAILKQLEATWENSEYQLTKAELLDLVKTKIRS